MLSQFRRPRTSSHEGCVRLQAIGRQARLYQILGPVWILCRKICVMGVERQQSAVYNFPAHGPGLSVQIDPAILQLPEDSAYCGFNKYSPSSSRGLQSKRRVAIEMPYWDQRPLRFLDPRQLQPCPQHLHNQLHLHNQVTQPCGADLNWCYWCICVYIYDSLCND